MMKRQVLNLLCINIYTTMDDDDIRIYLLRSYTIEIMISTLHYIMT